MEDRNGINGYNSANILGVWVSSNSLTQVLREIDKTIKNSLKNDSGKPFFLVTAYSETFLEAEKNPSFKKALDKASLIVADGVSVAAAGDYVNGKANWLQAGLNILEGKYKNRPVGAQLFRELLKSEEYKIYLSGGFNNIAGKVASKYKIVGWDNGDRDVKKINVTKADILFVSLGRFKQEIWISQNLDKLNVKVVVGVGSAFDEVGENWSVPQWVTDSGLKWLWRITRDPKHIRRAFNAFPIFPLKLFLWKRRQTSIS